ncbi:lytic transglycosylase [Hahella sp. CCB-MM4]|uniref:LysM peptidoglycan-binding domain-containing protein n=1 Tax=Hahella sp. (strain CCB-MM4) TaxID=1926491 RepID=UPI000B9A4A2C|nr:LysM peptidoglycan-binding domain-containing protein [Hahella sp. CCB-MM4]OZG73641.1 lytic transglycosylase [Hahella sp. CCB-MM4]
MQYFARLLAATQLVFLASCSHLEQVVSSGSQEPDSSQTSGSSTSPPTAETGLSYDLSGNPEIGGVTSQETTDNDQSINVVTKAEAQSDVQYLNNAGASTGDQENDSESPPSNDTALAVSKSLWDRMRSGFKLDLGQTNPRIETQLDWYARHQAYLDRTFERSSLYLHHIVSEAERRGIPAELALLPVVESAFDPFAYSHGRAAGIWQFIPGTGKHYGLRQTWWYDGRRDIVASTEAAFNYLSDMARFFKGDWLLALASYNSGAGTVQRAIRKNKARGKPTDFWHLDLPRETRAYVPKLLAIAKLVNTPKDYGVTLFPITNEPYFEVVQLDSQIDLSQAARLAQIDVDDLYILNPGYNQWATDPLGPHRLVLPVDKIEIFKQAYDDLPTEQRVNWTRYRVKAGDSLISIAKKFKTTPQVVRDVNRIRGTLIRQGQQLLIPSSYEGEDYYALSADNRLESKQARVTGAAGTTKVEYTVKSGDTLWDISRAYHVNVRKLAKWNGMAPGDVLSPGKKLVVWTKVNLAQTSTSPSSSPFSNREIIRKVGYRVRQGDSLYLIANKFNVSVNDLAKWNAINKNSILRPGQRLSIYVDVTEIN